MKFKRFITFICIVALLLQGAAVALPAFAQGINKPYVTQYGLYNYIDSNTESPSAVTVLTTGNTGENFSPPPWTVLNDVPYLFDSDDVIGIRFAVNVATPTYWDDNRTRLAMQDADGSLVPINVLRSGDGTSQDVNRNYIYVSQGRLEPASSYKITVDSGLTSNNGQQAGAAGDRLYHQARHHLAHLALRQHSDSLQHRQLVPDPELDPCVGRRWCDELQNTEGRKPLYHRQRHDHYLQRHRPGRGDCL